MNRVTSSSTEASQTNFVPSKANFVQKTAENSMSSMQQESSSYFSTILSCLTRPLIAVWNWIRHWLALDETPIVEKTASKPVPSKATNQLASPAAPPPEALDYNLCDESETKRLIAQLSKCSDYSQKIPYFEAYHREHEEIKRVMGQGSYDSWKEKLRDRLILSKGSKEEIAQMIQKDPYDAVRFLHDPFRLIIQEFDSKPVEYYFERLGVTSKDVQFAIFMDLFTIWLKKCESAKECKNSSVDAYAKSLLEEGKWVVVGDILEVNPMLQDQIIKSTLKAIDLATEKEDLRTLYSKLGNELADLKGAISTAHYIVNFKNQPSIAGAAEKYKKEPELANLIVQMVLKFEPELAKDFLNALKK